MKYDLINNKILNRYEFHIAEKIPFLDYTLRDDRMILTHTEVPPALEGHGVGTELVKQSLQDIRSQGLKIVPLCPFVLEFLELNPSYSDLV